MKMPWQLLRSPMAPGVPLEGSETVPGLRTLERQRLSELLQQPAGGGTAGGSGGGGGGGWRRSFQRYRGPFIEQLAVDDLKAEPKGWTVFWKGSDRGQARDAYSLPASLDVLRERTEENFVTFLPNYLRLAAGVLLATFYLRPKALLGAAAVAYSLYRSVPAAIRRQQAEAAAAAAAGAGSSAGPARRGAAGAAAGQQQQDPSGQAVGAAVTMLTWLLVAYTRCVPILLLGMFNALCAVLLHCALRRGPSEYKYRGRQPLGFTLRQVLGREPVPPGTDARALFRQLAAGGVAAAAARWKLARAYCRYYWHSMLDSLRFRRLSRSR